MIAEKSTKSYSNFKIVIAYTILCLFMFPQIYAQEVSDSLAVPAASDSLQTKKKKKKGSISSPIKYWADDIPLSNEGKVIRLIGNARIEYEAMTLTAAFIKINQEEKVLYAYGLTDSLDADSNLVVRGKPVFTDGGQEPMYGDSIEYNFETERGKISIGKTEMEPGYYRGNRVHRIADSTMLIKDGIFTSCEYIDDPHFYFQSEKIRMKVKDKVVAEPIVFYIADVPLAWLPFGVFPNKRGRHSGLVIPSYGESNAGGRFLRGLGYYWAPNEYFDATMLTDFYDKLGFAYRASARYNQRYKLGGNISAEYYPRDPRSGGQSTRWQVKFNHRQTIDPTMSITGSGSFVSDRKFSQELSSNIDERLNQNVTSSLSFSKSWTGTKNSMSASVRRNENLQTGTSSYTFPSISFSHSKTGLYETLTGEKLGSKRSWYQNIYFNYNSSLIHRGARTATSDSTFKDSKTQGIQHKMAFTAPQKVFKYFNISPYLNLKEDWVDEIEQAYFNEETRTVETKTKKQFAARHTFNTGITAKTTLYGMFEPNIGKLKYIRHKVDPSINFTYTPDFSEDFYNYFTSAYDSNGVKQYEDKFQNSPYSGTSTRESRRMSMSLGNVFQGKLVDEDGKESKFDILTANFSTAYDFMADSLGWSDLSASLRTKVFDKSINVRMIYDIYDRNASNQKLNEFLPFPKLRTLSTSMSYSLSNKTFAKKKDKNKDDEETNRPSDSNEGILVDENPGYERRDFAKETKDINIPWSTNFSFNYSYNRLASSGEPHTLNASIRANLQLTKNWKISWNARYNVVERDLVYHSFNFYRDLHCWEMSFGWQPTRNYYDFKINIKSSVLQDIKLTKHPRSSSYLR